MSSSIKEALEKALSTAKGVTVAGTAATPAPDDDWDDGTPESKAERPVSVASIQTISTHQEPAKESTVTNTINNFPTTVTTNTGKTHFKVTNNVTVETFNFVRNNPGLTRTQIVEHLVNGRGFKRNSVPSILSHIIQQNLARETEDRRVYAVVNEYRPIKSQKTWLKMIGEKPKSADGSRKKVTVIVKSKQDAAAPVPAPAPMPVYAPMPAPAPLPKPVVSALPSTLDGDADEFVNNLSVAQARAVYKALIRVFGGLQ